MSLYHNKYRIESARLKHWDYRNEGAYFITICTRNRECFFGACNDGEMRLTETGKTADNYWREIPKHFKNVWLGAHVVMPNHVHGILILENSVIVETLHCNVSTTKTMADNRNNHSDKNQFMADISPKSGSVSTIIRSYKSACTKWINQHYPEMNFGWQSRFHDHIIRNREEYLRIENYIVNNPGNWTGDKFNSQNCGT